MGYGNPSLMDMAEEVHRNAVEKGWFEEERTFGDGIALLHSEVSEALEAFRDHGTADATRPILAKYPCTWHGDEASGACTCKPQGVGSEFGDVLIRLLDECYRQGIDLDFEYRRKMHFNTTRPYKHGGRSL